MIMLLNGNIRCLPNSAKGVSQIVLHSMSNNFRMGPRFDAVLAFSTRNTRISFNKAHL